jgi:hypothetical protein
MVETNPTRNLVNYFKKNLPKGYTLESLKWSLVKQGYSRTLIDRALIQVTKELAEEAPILKDKPIIKHEVIDEHDKPITIEKSFWKKIVGQ